MLVFFSFFLLHTLIWFGTNYQLSESVSTEKSLIICLMLSIPTSALAFYSTKIAYVQLESAWAVKLFGFSVGYLVFPVLTWVFLNETPFNFKTISSVILAMLIICIQVFVPDSY